MLSYRLIAIIYEQRFNKKPAEQKRKQGLVFRLPPDSFHALLADEDDLGGVFLGKDMNILYICDTFESSSGVFQKVLAQTEQWEIAGHQVWLATLANPIPQRRTDIMRRHLRNVPSQYSLSLNDRISNQIKRRIVGLGIIKFTSMLNGIDLVYTRELSQGLGLLPFMKTTSVIVEINGDVALETRGLKRRNRVYRKNLQMRLSKGVVFVSKKLQDSCCLPSIPTTVIANASFKREKITLKSLAPPPRPSLVFVVAKNHNWHGLDKVLFLADNLPEFDFHIIGVPLSAKKNIISHGELSSDRLEQIMHNSHVGLSSLALHRKGMNEASPLKSRQYLANGLPIIQAYEDTDIAKNNPCVLQLPNTESNCRDNLGEIRKFVSEAYRSPKIREAALELAHGPLSIQKKEKTRLQFFKQCLGQINHV